MDKEKELKPRQKLIAELHVANPDMTVEEIANEVGVNPVTVYRLRRTPQYKKYEHELCQERFGDLEKIALKSLKENVQNNNQKAIEYVLDYLGYKATEKIEADLSSDINIVIDDD